MRLCELREKEVINTCNCAKIGCVIDVEIDIRDGCVEAIIVPGPGSNWSFLGTDSEYVIPFCCIKKIGPDIILAEVNDEKCLKKRK